MGVARYPAVNLLGAFDQQALHDAGVNTSAIDWQIPKFSDVVMQFDTEADMDTYCSARDYATTPSTTSASPRCGAISSTRKKRFCVRTSRLCFLPSFFR